MYSIKSTSHFSVVLVLPLLLLFLQGCAGTVQYLPNPGLLTGAHADILNFSDAEIDSHAVDQLYLKVARIMGITPNSSKPRPQVLVVAPAQIHQEYLRLHHSAKAQNGIALALYVPSKNRILIPSYDRTFLAHELAHYFTFHYLSVPRSDWEAIADKVVDEERAAP